MNTKLNRRKINDIRRNVNRKIEPAKEKKLKTKPMNEAMQVKRYVLKRFCFKAIVVGFSY